MIRPVTAVCLLMAGASGLYLYQTKHRTFMLDRQIEQTIRDTAATRERSNMLRADWALLNDTTRLSDLAARHLMLHQTAPTQFVTMAELDHRLPPIRAFKPDDTAPVTPSGAPAVASPGAVPMARATPAAVPGQAPVQQAFAQPLPTATPAAAVPAHPAHTAAVAVAQATVPAAPAATPAVPVPPSAPIAVAAARPTARLTVATADRHEAETGSREATTRETTTRETTTRETATHETATREATTRETAQREISNRDAALRAFASREPAVAPAIRPVITQAMATAIPRPVPVARTASYTPRMVSALGETTSRMPRPEPMGASTPVMVSSLGSGNRAMLAPPVPVGTNAAAFSQVR